MNRTIPVEGIPVLHETPLAIPWKGEAGFVVELDDEIEQRFRLCFSPVQAVKLITFDCYHFPKGASLIPRRVMEVLDSTWIEELKLDLRKGDSIATFMDKARHFILPLQDYFIEVVAWDVKVMELPEGVSYTKIE